MNIPKDKLVFNDKYELIEYFTRLIAHGDANIRTSERLDDAHKYVSEYCMPHGWGRNVWHTVLDDAIELRSKLRVLKAELADFEDNFINLGL